MKRILAIAIALAGVVASGAQNHPELEWRVLETEHFRVLFHQGLEGVAGQAARIAEQAYGPVTSLYGYEPGDKVRILLKDYDDYANGAAFYYQDTIEIWVTALEHEFELRGVSDWLSNVITHEFTHIVSLGAARKGSQRMPALYLQYLGYQREKNRPDILLGYPDVLASYPVMNTIVPMWFAEGVAQYMAEGVRHDRWDTHRDMILRTHVLNDKALSMDAMGVFGKCGFADESVYNHGYGLVRYIARTYGEERLRELARAAARWRSLTFDQAMRQSLGMGADELYAEWMTWMQGEYQRQLKSLGELHEGERLAGLGFANFRPAFSPTGDRLAYLSTRTRHYGPPMLVLREMESGEEQVLTGGLSSTPSWAPDGRRLLFVRVDRADRYGSRLADIYEYDLDAADAGVVPRILWFLPSMLRGQGPEAPQVRRLTHGLRALYPVYSPDGEWIAFVRNQGGSNNLGVMRKDGSGLRYLTDFADGTQLYTPQWSPDGRSLVFSIARAGQRDIALLRVDPRESRRLAAGTPLALEQAAAVEWLAASGNTERDPVWTADGRAVVFASDLGGIFNLYAIELETRNVRQLTNVVGGAFYPSVSPRGEVAFAAYGSEGYELWQVGLEGIRERVEGFSGGGTSMLPAAPPGWEIASQEYGIDFLKTSLMPRLGIDEGRLKTGLYLSSGDVLARQNVFAGGGISPASGDRELFAMYEYRGWRPTVFLEFIHQQRRTARNDSSAARAGVITGVNFNLNQLAAGLRGRVGRVAQVEVSAVYDRYDASVDWKAFEPRRDGTLGFELRKQKPFGYTYLHGFRVGFAYQVRQLARRRDREINPRGRDIHFRYDRHFNFFFTDFDQESSFVKEQFDRFFYHQFALDWKEYLGLPGNNTLGLRFYGGWIASDRVDEEGVDNFFDFHLGGLSYLKGYTFYSVEGRKAAMGTATWRFPLRSDWGRRFLHLYFDKLYGAVYGGLGKAWNGGWNEPDAFYGRRGPLREVGGQLRFDLISYYAMPTRVQLDLAYGIDEVKERNPWKFYLTVLFGYL